MSKVLVWDEVGEKKYSTGTKHGVIYPWNPTLKNGKGWYGTGVAWNGLTGVTESPSGADETSFWADDMKYLSRRGNEEFGLTIKAYYYPDEFAECDGTAKIANGVRIRQQTRKVFGFTWETIIGNDTLGDDYGRLIHIAYGVTASPSSQDDSTVNDSADINEFSWECTTNPIQVAGNKPTSVLEIDTTDANIPAGAIEWLEGQLYGTTADEFSTTSTYAVGDYVVYENKLYINTTAIATAGAWDDTKWSKISDTDSIEPNIPTIEAIVEKFGPITVG